MFLGSEIDEWSMPSEPDIEIQNTFDVSITYQFGNILYNLFSQQFNNIWLSIGVNFSWCRLREFLRYLVCCFK